MDTVRWDEEPVDQLSPLIGRQMLNGDAMTLARITLASGAVVPEHRHDNEQIATVVTGRLRFVVGDEERVVRAGESVLIPGGVPHSVVALEDSIVLDVVRAAPRGLDARRRRVPPRLTTRLERTVRGPRSGTLGRPPKWYPRGRSASAERPLAEGQGRRDGPRHAGAAARATTRLTGPLLRIAGRVAPHPPSDGSRAEVHPQLPSAADDRRPRPAGAAPRRRSARSLRPRPARPSSRPRPKPPGARRSRAGRSTTRRAGSRARSCGFYTIGSAGHESNALVALALRTTDPALLHYRSGGFYLARACQAGRDGVWDVLLGMAAAADEPIAGGRHKVFGHHDLAVIPQTSTIASHPPRAVGVAFAIERARELDVDCAWPLDAIVVCSFGDASLNHATAQSALNTAAHFAYQGQPLPILFVCEDNGIGISVPTPEAWVEQSLHGRPELAIERVDGDDPAAVFARAQELAAWVREHRHPAVLHLRTVRYLSHAGADLETAYRSGAEIRADYERDPLLATGRWLAAGGRSQRRGARGRLPRDARARSATRALEAMSARRWRPRRT